MTSTNIDFGDYLALTACAFEWVDSYDRKDWDKLRTCVAPTLRVDFRSLFGKLWETMPADDFVAMISSPQVIGDRQLQTQHFIGASKWTRTSDTEVTGVHQLRVPHQRYTDETHTAVAVKGHAHGISTNWYKKIDGEWKLAGVCPEVRWTEYDFDKLFARGEGGA
ncbi:Scytalone dehydratase [Epithele typhae]|uniref:Scytalone dehydratase n=1 Tax=Epithele typhae TaxID=378194 RepID=UPI0020089D61|nr:Scytalone dehydratase [Epithele typhae]KAH9921544.1 Scytalone dehydratase [Epithele typhae]